MPIDPQNYSPNEAWLLFQLNELPVQTKADGDFNVLAIVDVATGLIHGMEFVGALATEPSEFESRELLGLAESKAGRMPQQLFVDTDKKFVQLIAAAESIGLPVVPEVASNLNPLTREAREGFAAHLSEGRTQ